MTLGDLRCVAERVDINDLLGMFDAISTGSAPDLSTGFEIAAAFQECGTDFFGVLSGEGGPSPRIVEGIEGLDLTELEGATSELATCLQDVFGDEFMAQVLAGEFTPQLSDLAKLSECDIDLSQLDSLSELLAQ